jgi:hypothetical protein
MDGGDTKKKDTQGEVTIPICSCGGNVSVIEIVGGEDIPAYSYVAHCSTCCRSLPSCSSQQMAILQWNRAYAPHPIPKPVPYTQGEMIWGVECEACGSTLQFKVKIEKECFTIITTQCEECWDSAYACGAEGE